MASREHTPHGPGPAPSLPARRDACRWLALSAVAIAGGLAGCGGPDEPARAPVGDGVSGAGGDRGGASDASTGSAARVGEALAERADAYARGDRDAWLRAVAQDGDRSTAREDGAAYDVMRAIGVTSLAYVDPRPVEGAVACDLRYVVAGLDTAPAAAVTHWRLGAAPPRRSDAPALPWEEPGARGRRGRNAVAVAVGEEPTADLLRHAEAAVTAVRAVCGTDAPGAVVVMPATIETFGRWGAVDEVTDTPAVTVGPLLEGRSPGCDRIIVQPQLWSDLDPAGRQVVLTHEATHLFLRRAVAARRPVWLDEGFCEYVAWRGVELPEPAAVPSLVRLVGRQGVPEHLPDSSTWPARAPDTGTGGSTSVTGTGGPTSATGMQRAVRATTYAAGLLACRVIAERAGADALVRFVLSVDAVESTGPGFAGPLRRLTGWDLAGLEQAWRARVAAVAAAAP